MFVYDRSLPGREWRLFDEGRGLDFRSFGFAAAYSMSVARLLTWDGRSIPFEVEDVGRRDGVTGEAYALLSFQSFGSSRKIHREVGVGVYSFSSPEEEAAARLYAIEADLVERYKNIDGPWSVGGFRFIHNAREWRVDDFGYRSSHDLTRVKR